MKAHVRIRNMSESGAMIDGAALPGMGASLILRRGDIDIGGIVAWVQGDRCGIRFDGVAQVEEWVAGKRLPGRNKILTGQQRVDTLQAAIRLGRPTGYLDGSDRSPPAPEASKRPVDLYYRIGQEIAAVQRMLVATANDLSDAPVMLARYGSQLQAIQSASEVLDHLMRVLQAPDSEAAADKIAHHALRTRLLGKPLF